MSTRTLAPFEDLRRLKGVPDKPQRDRGLADIALADDDDFRLAAAQPLYVVHVRLSFVEWQEGWGTVVAEPSRRFKVAVVFLSSPVSNPKS